MALLRQLGQWFTPRTIKRRSAYQLLVETLEDRTAPAVFNVNTLADTAAVNLVTGTDATNNISLRSALDAANNLGGANTINLPAGTYLLSLGQLNVNGSPAKDDLTIAGAGSATTLIDPQNLGRAFNIFTGNTALISGVTIQNGSVTGSSDAGNGGGIFNLGNLTLRNSTLSNNTANDDGSTGGDGGGVYSRGTLTVIDSNFSQNSYTGRGGGIFQMFADLTVSGSAFSGNVSIGTFGDGGGIYVSSGVTAAVNNSSLTGNTAFSGGGIDNDGTMTLSNSTLSGNSGSFGGAISNGSGALTVSNATLSGNTAGLGGGIINSASGSVSVTYSTLSGNSATGNSGGGVYNSGALTVSNSTFSTNSATGLGGGTFNSGMLTVSNSTYFGNISNGVGGGGIFNNETLSISNSTFTGNSANAGNGGGIDTSGGALTLVNTIVAGNLTTGVGPDIEGAVAFGSHNLIGNGAGMSGISHDDDNENQVGMTGSLIDPLLDPLADNGGPTQTMALQAGSTAIGMGGAVTTVAEAAAPTDLAIVVANAAAIASTPGHYFILIDGEAMEVTSVNLTTNTLTVTRSINGFTASIVAPEDLVYLFTDQRGSLRATLPDIGAYEDTPAGATPAPTAGTVNDGLAADIAFQDSATSISANWSGFIAVAGIAKYELAIGTTFGGTDVQAFTDVGNVTSATVSGLTLTPGTTYFVSVRATDNLDAVSPIARSNGVSVATTFAIVKGDVLATLADEWSILPGEISTGTNIDFFKFTITAASGVFFDIDSRDTGLSTTLNSVVQVLDSAGVPIANGSNDDGYDFQGFRAPMSTTNSPATSPDSSLYLDLTAGTYYVSVASIAATLGNYELRLLADSNYSNTVPKLDSLAGAADTLYLDFNGHTSDTDLFATGDTDANTPGTQAIGSYVADSFDFNGNDVKFSPAERLAIQNIWRVIAEDFSPFKINVSTVEPRSFANGTGLRNVITNSPSTVVSPTGSFLGLASSLGHSSPQGAKNLALTFAASFGGFNVAGGISGTIMALALEQGNVSSHEIGHCLGLSHYASSTGSAKLAEVRQFAIMQTPYLGLSRKTFTAGKNDAGKAQDDLAIISSAGNTFGYRADDFGSTIATAAALPIAPIGYTASGIIAQVTDRDFFRFAASGPTTITLNVDEYANNLDPQLRLYNSKGVQLVSNDPAGPVDAQIIMNLPKGTYYLDVRGSGAKGDAGQYSLTIDTVLTTVSVDSGNLFVADIATSGKNDALEISLVGANIRIFDPNNRVAALVGATQIDDNTVEVPFASVTGAKGIVVNTSGGRDVLSLFFTGGSPIPPGQVNFDGGAGVDTLIDYDMDNTWNITTLGGGSITGDVRSFANVETLLGGAGKDVFRFKGNGALSGQIDGGPGINWLDFAGANTGVVVNLATGKASRVAAGVNGFDHVIGSGVGKSSLTGNDNGGVLVGHGRGNTLTAGAERSVLIGGLGVNTLIGGGADDLLINGRTIYDGNYAKLQAIFEVWKDAGKTYTERIDDLLDPLAPNPLDIGGTVFLSTGTGIGPRYGTGNFAYLSFLKGRGENDWFITGSLLTIFDLEALEEVTRN